MSTTLPPPRTLITNLLSALPPPAEPSTSSNPLKPAPSGTKPLLQTLHVLYPNEFLPALDLLDRHLLTRLTPPPQTATAEAAEQDAHARFYLVRSAQQSRQHYSTAASAPTTSSRHHDAHIMTYEVRLLAWNCSCPAFAFAAFPAGQDDDMDDEAGISPVQSGQWEFGGWSKGSNVPVCKHLLACVLVEHCEMFKNCVEERSASVEEIAGWAAGWGG